MVHIGQLDLSIGPGIVAVIGKDAYNTALRACSMGAHILEIRIDLLGINDIEELRSLLHGLKRKTGLPVIATNRCREEGGYWRGSEYKRIELLIGAIPDADAIDIELSSATKDMVIDAVRSAGKTLIISSHDFSTTPTSSAMLAVLEQARNAGADIAKLAVTPVNTADTLNLLSVTQKVDFPVCTIAMGKLGTHTRVVAPIYGSVLTYGSVDDALAPGQLRIDDLRNMMAVLV
jgi:3-dehydroquinate dehydratase-1